MAAGLRGCGSFSKLLYINTVYAEDVKNCKVHEFLELLKLTVVMARRRQEDRRSSSIVCLSATVVSAGQMNNQVNANFVVRSGSYEIAHQVFGRTPRLQYDPSISHLSRTMDQVTLSFRWRFSDSSIVWRLTGRTEAKFNASSSFLDVFHKISASLSEKLPAS